jgi:hypothetical protein
MPFSKESPHVRKTGKASFTISWIDDDPVLSDKYCSHTNTSSTSIETSKNCFGLVNLKFAYGNIGRECVLEMEMAATEKKLNMNKPLVSVVAIKDGVEKKMKFREGKWTVSWETLLPAKCERCDDWPMRTCQGVLFDVVIDFNRHSQQSTKSRSTQHLLNLFNNQESADVTFDFGNGTLLKGHSLVIASGSPVLAAMFKHNLKENAGKKVVEMAGIESDVFAVLLRFLYTGEVDLGNADAAEVMVAADKYAIDPLKEECASRMTQNLTVENATSYLVLAHLHNAAALQEATSEFIARNATFICSAEDWMMGVIKNYPELAFAIFQRLANF